jgi:spermidine synthase
VTDGPVEIARTTGVLGELVLRRRVIDDVDVVELVSNGVFLMDSGDASTERALARRALDAVATGPTAGRHVVVGGLGLGFTAAALLEDPRVDRVTVVEVEPALVSWVRQGLVPSAAALLDDVRVDVRVGDVAEVVPGLPEGCADAVLLDVDNGPGFLVHPDNAGLYTTDGLTGIAHALRRGGCVVVWSADRSPDLARALEQAVGPCEEQTLVVHRAGRDLEYVLYTAVRR